MTANFQYATDLEIHVCPTCFVAYAIPKTMHAKKLEDGGDWYCPNGHTVCFTETKYSKAKAEADSLRRERDRLTQNQAWYEDNLKAERASNRALRSQVTKISKRVGQGVCPCCNRQFVNLQRHMAGKHPAFAKEAA